MRARRLVLRSNPGKNCKCSNEAEFVDIFFFLFSASSSFQVDDFVRWENIRAKVAVRHDIVLELQILKKTFFSRKSIFFLKKK